MKTSKLLGLFASLFLLAIPAAQILASGNEVEIVLMEVSGFLPGNDPLGNPQQEGDDPPRPTDFFASIDGSTLEITSGTNAAQLIVFDDLGTPVLNSQFVGSTIEQIFVPGFYSLEIQSGSLTLVGAFEVQ